MVSIEAKSTKMVRGFRAYPEKELVSREESVVVSVVLVLESVGF